MNIGNIDEGTSDRRATDSHSVAVPFGEYGNELNSDDEDDLLSYLNFNTSVLGVDNADEFGISEGGSIFLENCQRGKIPKPEAVVGSVAPLQPQGHPSPILSTHNVSHIDHDESFTEKLASITNEGIYTGENSTFAVLVEPIRNEGIDEQGDSDAELYNRSSNVKMRYFIDPVEIICRTCQQPGHIARQCPDKKENRCYLCGDSGHRRQDCPRGICYNCGNSGHVSRDCKEHRKRRRDGECYRCHLSGHNAIECPDIWRQYYASSEDRKNKRSRKTLRKYCYQCGKEGHFGDDCQSENTDRYSVKYTHTAFHSPESDDERLLMYIPDDTSIHGLEQSKPNFAQKKDRPVDDASEDLRELVSATLSRSSTVTTDNGHSSKGNHHHHRQQHRPLFHGGYHHHGHRVHNRPD